MVKNLRGWENQIRGFDRWNPKLEMFQIKFESLLLISFTFVKSREEALQWRKKKKIKEARYTATTKLKVIHHFQRATVVLCIWVSGNFSFIYLQKTHKSNHDFRDTKQKVVFSFPFLQLKFMFCCSFLIRQGQQHPFPTSSFSTAPIYFF